MTLLALTLAVGIVIDDAIIVLENIFRFMEEKGRDRVQAAIEATQEIGLAVMATTLSLIIIFLPIAFMTGYARKYVNSFGWTMAMAILVSLLVAFTLTPMMSSRLLRVDEREQEIARSGIFALGGRDLHEDAALVARASTDPGDDLYRRHFSPHSACIISWDETGFPADDQSELQSSFTLPEGTSLEKTSQMASDMAQPYFGPAGSGVCADATPTGRPITRTFLLGLCRAANAS